MREGGVAGTQRLGRGCVRVGAKVREGEGGGLQWCRRRCARVGMQVRSGGARYSILGVNRNQSEPIGIYRRKSDKL